jgi:hypothetical protein
LLSKLKWRVKGYHFQTLDSVQKAVTDAIKTLTEADFQSCWGVENYFQGDNADSDE